MNTELISVIMPAYNSGATIERAITSLLQQTYQNLQILIIDDNSTDSTAEIVQKLIEKNSRIEYFKLPFTDPHRINFRGVNVNAGYMARNYGFEKAIGTWLTFQDADDTSLLNRIEVQHDLAQKYNSNHVCIEWQQLKPELIGKKLDVKRIFEERNDIVITPEEINKLVLKTKGVLMGSWFPHAHVPFIFKWFHVFRPLFFKSLDSYPCAGNNALFKHEVIDTVRFRRLNDRIWPTTRGRGADRDFNFQVAETFKNSYAFRLPLYLWKVGGQNPDHGNFDQYII